MKETVELEQRFLQVLKSKGNDTYTLEVTGCEVASIKGKTAYELEPEEFEKLFCQRCSDYESCSRKPVRMVHCSVLVEIGRWGEFTKISTLKQSIQERPMGGL